MTLSISKIRKTSIAHVAMSSTCMPAGAKALKLNDQVIVEQMLGDTSNWMVRWGTVAEMPARGVAKIRFEEGDEQLMPAFVSSARHLDYGVQNIRFAS